MRQQIKKNISGKKPIIVVVCLAMVFMMSALVYASPTLYQIFCDVTGFGGTPKRVVQASYDESFYTGKKISIRFDANSDPNLPVEFYALENQIQINIGQKVKSYYVALNNSDKRIATMAVFNVEPEGAAQYLNKIECFCFTEQQLEAKQKKMMPILYFVDPAILDDQDFRHVNEIVMSYTIFAASS